MAMIVLRVIVHVSPLIVEVIVLETIVAMILEQAILPLKTDLKQIQIRFSKYFYK